MFWGIVVQQAIEITVEGNSVVFTFSSAHRSSRADLERRKAWLEELARTSTGRKLSVVAREVAAAPVDPATTPAAAARQQQLKDKAKENPGVQAILEVFGGEVEDVEEIK